MSDTDTASPWTAIQKQSTSSVRYSKLIAKNDLASGSCSRNQLQLCVTHLPNESAILTAYKRHHFHIQTRLNKSKNAFYEIVQRPENTIRLYSRPNFSASQ